jgi:hypothetical protein
MTPGAELLIRTANTVTYTAVTRNGHRVVDWLTRQPNLKAPPLTTIQDWLNFYQPTQGDLSFAATSLTVSCPGDPKPPEDSFNTLIAAVHRQAKQTLNQLEYETVTKGSEYLVLIQESQVIIRHNNKWQSLHEMLLHAETKLRPPESPTLATRACFVSNRGIPLVGKPEAKPVLTVELTDKWNDLYIIYTDGKVNKLLANPKYAAAYREFAENFPELTEGNNSWNPHFLWQFSNRVGISLNTLALDLLIGRWTRERDSFFE